MEDLVSISSIRDKSYTNFNRPHIASKYGYWLIIDTQVDEISQAAVIPYQNADGLSFKGWHK